MGRCRFCGRATSLESDQHQECRERHERAIALIPGFFEQILEYPIEVPRFRELLQEAAKASFVGPEILRSLAVEGMSRLMVSVLARRLPSAGEVQRIRDVVQALTPELGDTSGFEESMAKIEILRELYDGRIEEWVEVQSELPMELRRGETVIWIFNQVKSIQAQSTEFNPPAIALPANDVSYVGLNEFSRELADTEQPAGDSVGDVALTNLSLYFISLSGKITKVPIGRMSSIIPYVTGITIAYGGKARSCSFGLSDPWFMANAIVALSRHARGSEREAPERARRAR